MKYRDLTCYSHDLFALSYVLLWRTVDFFFFNSKKCCNQFLIWNNYDVIQMLKSTIGQNWNQNVEYTCLRVFLSRSYFIPHELWRMNYQKKQFMTHEWGWYMLNVPIRWKNEGNLMYSKSIWIAYCFPCHVQSNWIQNCGTHFNPLACEIIVQFQSQCEHTLISENLIVCASHFNSNVNTF